MKNYLLLLLIVFHFSCQTNSSKDSAINFVADDLSHFYEAFDLIQSTSDTAAHREALETLFLEKASPGQKAMIAARRYSADEYLEVIRSYPRFWESIRPNMQKHQVFSQKMKKGIQQFQKQYPAHKPATVYFTVGAFRSPGTAVDSLVLIGSEFAFGDNNTVTTEFPDQLTYVADYYKNFSIDDIAFLSIHEYVHSQQNTIQYDLPSLFLYEGIAEFMATLVAGPSPLPSMTYSKEHHELIRAEFEQDIGNRRVRGKWLWNNNDNVFGVADVGYYVGYAMAKAYYDQASDKEKAIQTLIELNLEDKTSVYQIVDKSVFLSSPVDTLLARYESARPSVIKIREFENGSQNVSPGIKTITLEVSQKLDPRFRSTGFGELGKPYFPKANNILFSEDSLAVIYEVELEKNKRYQLLLESGYRTPEGVELVPFLVDFKTQ